MFSLRDELSVLLSSRFGALTTAVSARGVNDRVDALVLLCREMLRCSTLCMVDGVPHYFDGVCHVSVRFQDVLSELGNLLIDSGASPTDVRKMGDMPLSVIRERAFSRPSVLCFRNGTLDLSDGSFVGSFSSSRVSVERLDYDYDPGAGCPAWEAFLSEVLPDAATRLVLQEFFGMVFLDRERLSVEKFALFIGSGANGKSVVGDVIRRVLGPDGVSSLDTAQLRDEKMLPFVGKRLNFVPDMGRGKDFDSTLKALASGQEVTARRNYSDPERVKCPPLCFALNELPVFHDTTPAFFRRLLLFRFGVTIPTGRQNRALSDEIVRADASGVFNWILAGRDRLVRRRGAFSACPSMDAELDALRTDVAVASKPAQSYLDRMGYQLRPVFTGQNPVLVSQNEIALGLCDTVSRYAITSELRSAGVMTFRSKELFYKVYPKKQDTQ